jgi:glutamine amidotransferase
MIAIIDFGAGNLKSIYNGLCSLGHRAIITQEKKAIHEADALVIPGVGAFKDSMENLRRYNLIEVLLDSIIHGKPVLGICLGLQLLFMESEEFGLHSGMGIVKGRVKAFCGPMKIPHMGWNTVHIEQSIPLLKGIRDEEFFYFVHSYYAEVEEEGIVAGTTHYGITFPSVIQKGNLMATQFHPEKSSKPGLQILDNFARMAQ